MDEQDPKAQDSSEFIWPCLVDADEQLWLQRGGRFVQVVDGDRSYPLDGDLDAIGPSRCTESGQLLPGSFRYSPFTGAPATRVVTTSGAERMAAPFGGSDGLSELVGFDIPELVDQPEAVSLPPGGPFEFAVAGRPERLLAIDRSLGRLYRWSFSRSTWSDAAEIGHSNAPDGTWASAVAGGYLAMPTTVGLTIVDPGGVQKPETVHVVSGAGGIGPAVRGDSLLWPCVRDGHTVLVRLDVDDLESEQAVEIEVGSDALFPDLSAPVSGPGDAISAPAVDGLGYAYWASRPGYLCAEPNGRATWVPLSSGLALDPRFRPCRDHNGLLYQLGFSETANHYFHCRLHPAAVRPEVNPLEGWHLSAGSSTFRSDRRYHKPWTESRIKHLVRPGHFILPLLAFANDAVIYAIVEGRIEADRFFAGEAC